MGLCFLLHGLKSVVITTYNMLQAHQPHERILKWCFVFCCIDKEVLGSQQIMCCDRVNLNRAIFLVAWTNIFHWRVGIGLKICKRINGEHFIHREFFKKEYKF